MHKAFNFFLVENSENYRGIYVRRDSEGRLLVVCVCMRKMSFNGPLFATIRTVQDGRNGLAAEN